MSDIEIDYEALKKEIFDKIAEGKKLLLEANALVPKAKFEDFSRDADYYNASTSKYAVNLAEINFEQNLNLLDLIDSFGWNSSSLW